MIELIGVWYLLQTDPVEDVSTLATTAWNTAIPVKKRLNVLYYLAPEILRVVKVLICSRPISKKIYILTPTHTHTLPLPPLYYH